jgi:Predicted enzyme of the cupin superfamily
MSETPSDMPQGLYATDAEGELGTWNGLEVGVWECPPRVETDTEADEIFVVLTGRATIDFTEPPHPSIEIGPGDVVRLNEGQQTRWTVHETLRKVYVTPKDNS